MTPYVLREFGIKTALDEAITRFKSPALMDRTRITGSEDDLDYATTLSVYRIIQELLNNIVKHAAATEARIELSIGPEKVKIRVQDNGKGMTNEDLHSRKGVGLNSIQNRVKLIEGELKLTSEPGKGSLIEITFNRDTNKKISMY